jgi:hypothetical protein
MIALSFVFIGWGCAFSNLTVHPPSGPIASGIRGGQGREIVLEVAFSDDRPTPKRCGMQKNGFNADTANVFCSREPSAYLAELLANELKEVGFTVTPEPQSSDPLKIHGKLLQFFVEPKLGLLSFTPEADIYVHLTAASQSGLMAERDFYVKGEETSVFGWEKNFQLATDEATRRIIKEMAAAILALCDRFPEVGIAKAMRVSLRTTGDRPR